MIGTVRRAVRQGCEGQAMQDVMQGAIGGGMRRRTRLAVGLALALAVLAACDSAEERAEKHFEAGMALLEKGDVDRAMVEFRNVFQLNGRHREARLTYAGIERERGNLKAAYGQYLRVVEQYPDELVALRALAEMAVDNSDWPEARRHGAAAAELAPGDPVIRAVVAATDYQTAVDRRDAASEAAAIERARALMPELAAAGADSFLARRVVLDSLLKAEDWPAARAELDAALAERPDRRALQTLRIQVLERLGDEAGLEAQLKEMTERFPDDPEVHGMLLRWYLSRQDPESAEAHLRARVAALEGDPKTRAGARMALVNFLVQVRGPDVARAEIDRIVAADPAEAAVFRALRAGLDFDAGDRTAAIAEMEAALQGRAPGPETHGMRIGLARMLDATGNRVGARAEVEQVLSEDATSVEALKLKAGWLIDDDKTGDAMLALRAALGQAPRDAQVMTLMARAHERDGNRDLMAEMLSLAVEASGRAPDETLRYASHLVAEKKHLAAEEALINALRQAPGHVGVLNALGTTYIAMQDWPRTEQVVAALRGLGRDEAVRAADGLTARLLAAQSRDGELAAFLEGLAGQGGAQGALGAEAALIRLSLATGDTAAAAARARRLVEADPADPARRFLLAQVLARAGEDAEAETILRALVAEDPRREPAWRALHGVLAVRGDREGATRAIADALAALPGSVALRWAQASQLQAEGDIDGAIAVYEALYAEDTASPLFANNLASLLSTARDDPESLERAHVVARRLRGSEIAAFQDTYGWIAFRRGQIEEAVLHLEPAAKGLPEDAQVQFHLGMAYAAQGDAARAETQFARAEALLDPALPPPPWLPRLAAERARLAAAGGN
jgi:predicted Zn-dependent protease